jgi:hypothetical protein
MFGGFGCDNTSTASGKSFVTNKSNNVKMTKKKHADRVLE